MRAVLLAVVLIGCGGGKSPEPPQPQPPIDVPVAVAADAAVVVATPDAAAGAPTPEPPPDPSSTAGADFTQEARWLYHVAGCGTGPTPEAFAVDPILRPKYQQVIDKHCKALAPHIAKFREVYFVAGRKWLDEHVPAGIPSTVVYPFGGGDLLSAVAAFPKATEITTISLELAGDPRRLPTLTVKQLETDLATFRNEVSWLIQLGSNTSVNLSAQQRNSLPGQTSSFLLALHVGGYELVGMRYFTIDDSGAIHYVTQAEIDADTKATKALSNTWSNPNFAKSFTNVEIKFRKVGETAIQTHRHVAWNLDDKHLKDKPGLLRHLEAKGKVTFVVKGASYLLYRDDFKTMRDYLLAHLAFMLSDSTGIPPMYAKPAGMVQEAWGRYVKPGLAFAVGSKQDLDMRTLWKKPAGPAPFRFGYIDSNNNAHILITRPK